MIHVLVPGLALDERTNTLYVDPPRAAEALGLHYDPCDHYHLAAHLAGVLQRDYGYGSMQVHIVGEGADLAIEVLATEGNQR